MPGAARPITVSHMISEPPVSATHKYREGGNDYITEGTLESVMKGHTLPCLACSLLHSMVSTYLGAEWPPWSFLQVSGKKCWQPSVALHHTLPESSRQSPG